MKTITLEEHFVTHEFLQATGAYGESAHPALAAVQPKLLDLGAGRIAAMDEGGVDVQVMSLASMGIDKLEAGTATALITGVNDELAAAIQANPTRLAGFAALNLREPENAAQELARCVTKLGFVGALVDGTVASNEGPLFLDDERFTPFWEAAAHLQVPVYLHPALPPAVVQKAYFSGLPGDLGMMLSIAGWGWHAETGLHTLRLIVSGLFDRLPDLRLIIGHMGEGLPYALARSSGILSRVAHLKQTVADYFRTHIYLTTSGYFSQPPLQCAVEVVGIDRMLFSVDYPFSSNAQGKKFLLDAAGWLTAADIEKLQGSNAEKALKLSPEV
jgi:predicted TIM-barrel fold metal-dependent hydrolase